MPNQESEEPKDDQYPPSHVVPPKIEVESYEQFILFSARDQVISSVFDWMKSWVYNPLVWIVGSLVAVLTATGLVNAIGVWVDHTVRVVAEEESKEVLRKTEEQQQYLFARLSKQIESQEKKLSALDRLYDSLLEDGVRLQVAVDEQSKAIEDQWSSLRSYDVRFGENETALAVGNDQISTLTTSFEETSSTLRVLLKDMREVKAGLPQLMEKVESAKRGINDIENSTKRLLITELGSDEEFLALAQTEYPAFDEPDATAIRNSLFLRAAMAERLILLTKSGDAEVRARALRGLAIVHLIARDADLERRIRQSRTFATESDFKIEFYTQAVGNVQERYVLVRPKVIVDIVPLLNDPSENVRELAAVFLSRVRFDDPADARLLLDSALLNPDASKNLAPVVLFLNPQEFEKISEDLLHSLTSRVTKENSGVIYFALVFQPRLRETVLEIAIGFLGLDISDPRFEVGYNLAMNLTSKDDERCRDWVRKSVDQSPFRILALGFIGRVYDRQDEEMMGFVRNALSSSDADVRGAAADALEEIIVREKEAEAGIDSGQSSKWVYYHVIRRTARSFLGIQIGRTKVAED